MWVNGPEPWEADTSSLGDTPRSREIYQTILINTQLISSTNSLSSLLRPLYPPSTNSLSSLLRPLYPPLLTCILLWIHLLTLTPAAKALKDIFGGFPLSTGRILYSSTHNQDKKIVIVNIDTRRRASVLITYHNSDWWNPDFHQLFHSPHKFLFKFLR